MHHLPFRIPAELPFASLPFPRHTLLPATVQTLCPPPPFYCVLGNFLLWPVTIPTYETGPDPSGEEKKQVKAHTHTTYPQYWTLSRHTRNPASSRDCATISPFFNANRVPRIQLAHGGASHCIFLTLNEFGLSICWTQSSLTSGTFNP